MNRAGDCRLICVMMVLVLLTGCATWTGKGENTEAALTKQLADISRRLEALESRQRNMTDILAKARGAVAYIWGTYTFVDKEGRPLRHVVNELGVPVADPRGFPLVDVKGTGPLAVSNYCGTAFIAGPGGLLLTNRHIAEPWWEDEKSEPLLAAGLKPVFIRLRAFFQERVESVPLEVLRLDERHDIALVRTVGWAPTARPLSLHANPGPDLEGQGILIIGYPTGLEAVLAKLEEEERMDLEEETGECTFETAERLSEQKRLRPTITSGFLWDVLPHLLVYDARTSGGGSGGPILDWRGTVIGVNSAYLEEFLGGNYGVPIQFGKVLMAGGGKEAATRAESPDLRRLYEHERAE